MKNKLFPLIILTLLLFVGGCHSGKNAYKTKMTKQYHKKEKVGHTPKKGNVFNRLFSSN